MQLANNHPMLISEHKRTSYDKDGAVEKIDILRSIRRKDTQPSFLPSFLQKSTNDENSSSSKLKQIVQYFLIATIIFCTLLLIMNICGITLQVNTDSAVQPAQQNEQSLLKFSNNSIIFSNINSSFNQQPIASVRFDSINEAMSSFQTQLQNQLLTMKNDNSQQSETRLLNLNEFTKSIAQNDHNLQKILLSNFAQTLNCRIELNKIICQHELTQ